MKTLKSYISRYHEFWYAFNAIAGSSLLALMLTGTLLYLFVISLNQV